MDSVEPSGDIFDNLKQRSDDIEEMTLYLSLWLYVVTLMNQPNVCRRCTTSAAVDCIHLVLFNAIYWIQHEGHMLGPLMTSTLQHQLCDEPKL